MSTVPWIGPHKAPEALKALYEEVIEPSGDTIVQPTRPLPPPPGLVDTSKGGRITYLEVRGPSGESPWTGPLQEGDTIVFPEGRPARKNAFVVDACELDPPICSGLDNKITVTLRSTGAVGYDWISSLIGLGKVYLLTEKGLADLEAAAVATTEDGKRALASSTIVKRVRLLLGVGGGIHARVDIRAQGGGYDQSFTLHCPQCILDKKLARLLCEALSVIDDPRPLSPNLTPDDVEPEFPDVFTWLKRHIVGEGAFYDPGWRHGLGGWFAKWFKRGLVTTLLGLAGIGALIYFGVLDYETVVSLPERLAAEVLR